MFFLKIVFIYAILFSTLSVLNAIEIHTNFVTNSVKNYLLTEYGEMHYGMTNIYIIPKMIVIHYTGTGNLRETLTYFSGDRLETDRSYELKHGAVNVGAHFLIDRDGTIYQLYPANMMARHIVSFNNTSIGIENIATTSDRLTGAQLVANRELVMALSKAFPTIRYLIGHQEYNETNLAHFSLFCERDRNYKMMKKDDPGKEFLSILRKQLKDNGVQLDK